MKSVHASLVKKDILGIGITDATQDQVLEYVSSLVAENGTKAFIVTPNPEIVMYALSHPSYASILNQAAVSLCDGVGLFKAAAFLGKPVKQRISGVDFMEKLCEQSAKKTVTVGFLGGRDQVAERAAECLVKKYPGLKVAFVGEEWGDSGFMIQDSRHKDKKVENIVNPESYLMKPKSIDILFVAYGFPKQEIWMAEHLQELPIKVMMGVGGSFDIVSGDIPRAPAFMRTLGLEWLYRLLREPWRIKRQLALPAFLLVVFKQRFINR